MRVLGAIGSVLVDLAIGLAIGALTLVVITYVTYRVSVWWVLG